MQFFQFHVWDSRISIAADKIVSIQETADRLTIRTTDGQSTDYDYVYGTGWTTDPEIDYWEATVPGLCSTCDDDEDGDGDEEFVRQLNLIS